VIYNSSGDPETAIWEGQIGLWNNSGTTTFQLYGDNGSGTARMEFRTSGGEIYFWNGGKIYGTSSAPVELEHVSGRFSYSGALVFSGNCPSTWTDRDLSSVVGARRALVFLRVRNNAGFDKKYRFRPNGETCEYSSAGVIEWMSGASEPTDLWVMAYIT